MYYLKWKNSEPRFRKQGWLSRIARGCLLWASRGKFFADYCLNRAYADPDLPVRKRILIRLGLSRW